MSTTLPILRENIIEIEKFKTQDPLQREDKTPTSKAALQFTNNWN